MNSKFVRTLINIQTAFNLITTLRNNLRHFHFFPAPPRSVPLIFPNTFSLRFSPTATRTPSLAGGCKLSFFRLLGFKYSLSVFIYIYIFFRVQWGVEGKGGGSEDGNVENLNRLLATVL